MKWFLTVVVALTLFTTGCTTRQAQVGTRTAFTAAMEGVVAGDEVLATALPGAGARARERAEERCQTTCPDLATLVLEEMRPWEQALTGLQHARSVLYLADDSVGLWIDTGTLPDFGPICSDIEDVFGDLVELLEAVGVEVPSVLDRVVPNVSTACEVVATYMSGR